MKKTILTCAILSGALSLKAQNNPAANPVVWGINAAASPIELGDTTTTTFDLGNNGNDPIPAGGAVFSISFPPNVTVDQSTLNMDGGAGIFTPTWFVDASGTYLTLDVSGPGIPAFTFLGPQTIFHMKVIITGAVVGSTPLQQTINARPEPDIAQNANAGDDNANGPIRVVPVGALPINLLSFTGKRMDGHTARLQWEVADPDRFSHFELERSADGKVFTKVARVMLTEQTKYQHDDDISGLSGNVLYRLRMVDADASFKLSNIVSLRLTDNGEKLSVYPNPATSSVQISGFPAGATLRLMDVAGHVVSEKVAAGSKEHIDLSSLPSALYYVQVVKDRVVIATAKVSKQ